MKLALIGHGMVAPTYLRAIEAAPDLSLAMLCGRNAARLESFAAQHNCDAELCTTLDHVAKSDIDFAIIATPPNARKEAVEILCRAGKPILMEKPVERSAQAALAIVEHCEAADIPLGIVFQHRARAPAIRLKSMLDDDAFGRIGAVEILIPWWRDQAYYDAPGRGSYAQDGGGVLITQAIHTLDLALSLLGPVARVQAMARRTALHDLEAEDFVSAGLEFQNGATGMLFASTASFPGREEQIVIHGTRGSAQLKPGGLSINWRDGTSESDVVPAGSGGGADPMAFTHAWHQAVIEDFAVALRDKRPPLCTGREALEVHALIDAIIRSSDANSIVEIPQ